MADFYSRQSNIVVSHVSERESNQCRGTGHDGKRHHKAEPIFHESYNPVQAAVVRQKPSQPANSEYGAVGTWASIVFSSATIFGLRNQT
jgi:hypothetical protein